jgi:hypothetical protein
MPPKKAAGISFGTTKGVSEITVSDRHFKASWTSAGMKSYFMAFEAVTAAKIKINVFWVAPRIVCR